MSDTTIQWTDKTWNPVRGCTKISPGCKNCYAETFAERWRGIPGHPYEQGFDLRLVPEKLDEPLHWRKPAKIFVNSMSDLFQEGVPTEFIARVFNVMSQAQRHTFQILTKRPERMLEYASSPYFRALPNVWLGVSVENQETLGRIDILKDVPASVRFVSFEPLLEDLGAVILDRIHWAIIGGESGPKARPLHIQWIRNLMRQCKTQNVATFVKQMGRRIHERNDRIADVWYYADGSDMDTEEIDYYSYRHQGEPVRLKLKDSSGGDPAEWPEDLRVRQFPQEVFDFSAGANL